MSKLNYLESSTWQPSVQYANLYNYQENYNIKVMQKSEYINLKSLNHLINHRRATANSTTTNKVNYSESTPQVITFNSSYNYVTSINQINSL